MSKLDKDREVWRRYWTFWYEQRQQEADSAKRLAEEYGATFPVSSCAATLTAYVDELERRAREQKEWEGHPKYEGEYPSEVMQVIVNELRERFTLPESEATVAFHKLLQDEGEEYEGPKEDHPVSMTMEKYHEFLAYEAECKLRDARSANAEPVVCTKVEILGRPNEPVSARCILNGCRDMTPDSVGIVGGQESALSSTAAPEAVALAEQWKGRADDCGRLARAVLDAPLSATEGSKDG